MITANPLLYLLIGIFLILILYLLSTRKKTGADALKASFTYVPSIKVTKKGDIILSESSETSNRIRKIDGATHQISTIAGNNYGTFSQGGNYLTLRSFAPGIIALTPEGYILASDGPNNRVFLLKY